MSSFHLCTSRELTKRDPFGYEGNRYVNPQPRIILEIADCSERINLEFELHSALDVENSQSERAGAASKAPAPESSSIGGCSRAVAECR